MKRHHRWCIFLCMIILLFITCKEVSFADRTIQFGEVNNYGSGDVITEMNYYESVKNGEINNMSLSTSPIADAPEPNPRQNEVESVRFMTQIIIYITSFIGLITAILVLYKRILKLKRKVEKKKGDSVCAAKGKGTSAL